MSVDANTLLREIMELFNSTPNRGIIVDGGKTASAKFPTTRKIAEEIENFLAQDEQHQSIDDPVQEAFNPYTDPETKAMLERAGIPTYQYRR